MLRDNIYEIVSELARAQGNYEIAMKCNTANMMNTLNQKQERQQLVKEIAGEVISRISIMFDTDNAISKIKALNEAINKLEQ